MVILFIQNCFNNDSRLQQARPVCHRAKFQRLDTSSNSSARSKDVKYHNKMPVINVTV